MSTVAACAVVGMVGCGGGSSSTVATETSKVSGVAVDDLILNGVVEVTNVAGDVLASGRTDASNGSYALDLDYSGVVMLQVRCDENSMMLTPEGNVTCPSEMSLRSVADVKAGVEQEVNISPLTEVVVQRAQSMGETITSEVVESARTEIGLMFGVDPIADDPTEGPYSDVVSAIHEVAETTDADVLTVIEDLAEELSDGSADGEEDTILSALVDEMDDLNLTNNLTESDGDYIPPENPADLTDIESAKAFMAEVRTQTSEADSFITTEEAAINSALESELLDLEYIGNSVNMIADGIGYMSEENLTSIETDIGDRTYALNGSDGSYSYTITEGDKTWSGSVTFPGVLLGDEAVAEIYKEQTLTMNVQGTFPLGDVSVTEEGVEDSQSFEGTLTTIRSGTVTTISLTGKAASNGTSVEIKAFDAELAYSEGEVGEDGNAEPVLEYLKLNKLDLEGIVDGYTVNGVITVNAYTQNSSLSALGGMYEVEEGGFGGYISCSGSRVVDGSVSVTFTYDGTTYEPNYTDEGGDNYYFGFDDLPANLEYDELTSGDYVAFSATCEDESVEPELTINWSWGYTDEELANNGWVPSEITFEGSVVRENAALNGTLNAKWLNAATMEMVEDSNETAMVEVSFSGKLQMPDRPEMLTTLTFKNAEVENNIQNTVAASYTYDATVINATAVMDEALENGSIEITNQSGMKANMNIANGSIDANSTLTKDGHLLGTFEEREDAAIIKYIDGSFETLF